MHYLTLINRTAAIADGSSQWMDTLFEIELALIIWSYIECGSMFYMLCVTTQYHPNLSFLLKHLVGQYFFSMAARIVQIYKMYGIRDERDLRLDTVFTTATLIRNWLTFIAFYFAPFAMLERSFATYYMQDYEHNQRRNIGYILATVMHSFCFLSAGLYVLEVIPVYYHLASFVCANILAFVICLANDHFNHKKFMEEADATQPRAGGYSLSERYQVAENLRTAHLFKRGISFIIVFSISCSSFISAEVFRHDESLRNWMHVGFNYSAIVYGVGLPAAMYYYNDQWKAELVRLFRKMMCCHYSCSSENRMLRTTLGHDMNPDREQETGIYFDLLERDWNRKKGSSVSPIG